MTDESSDTQLRSRRIPFKKRVLITPRDGSDRRYETAFDLSLGGMFIETMLPLDPGELLDLEMHIDQMRFQTTAEVAWIRTTEPNDDEPVGMAIRFVSLNPHQKKLIHRQIVNHTQSGGQLRVGKPPQPGARPSSTPTDDSAATSSASEGIWGRMKSILRR